MNYDSSYWNKVINEIPVGQDYDILLAEHYRHSHLKLINRWIELGADKKVLKTDLFAEAMCPERSFFRELVKSDCLFTATDISNDICLKAKHNTNHNGKKVDYVATDIRYLPFNRDSFDIIISDSTLDHYKDKKEIKTALKEIARTLKPGGILIITLDNKSNITEPLFRLYISLGLSPFYIGKTCSMKELKKTLQETGFKTVDEDYLIHNPRFFTKLLIKILRNLDKKRSSKRIIGMLTYFDSLQKKSTRALTSQFIAVKAEKI